MKNRLFDFFYAPHGLPRGLFTQHVKDRASRTQSENSFSGFAETQPIFEA